MHDFDALLPQALASLHKILIIFYFLFKIFEISRDDGEKSCYFAMFRTWIYMKTEICVISTRSDFLNDKNGIVN